MIKNKNLTQEKILSYIFWFLFFLILISFLTHYYNVLEYKKNTYKGLLSYYYNEKNQQWETEYYIKGKKYIIPFYSDPKEFENYSVFGREINDRPTYIFLVFRNESNYSIITTSFFNLARVLNPKGYYSFVYLYPAILKENNTIEVILNRNSSRKIQGYIDCNMKEALFIILDDKSNNYIRLNNSCVFLNGNNTDILKGVDKLTIILLKNLEEKD